MSAKLVTQGRCRVAENDFVVSSVLPRAIRHPEIRGGVLLKREVELTTSGLLPHKAFSEAVQRERLEKCFD